MKKHRISPEIKEQIINRIKNDGVTVSQAAKDHGVSEASIYAWLGAKTEGGPSTMDMVKLKKENEELLKMVGLLTMKLSESQKKR